MKKLFTYLLTALAFGGVAAAVYRQSIASETAQASGAETEAAQGERVTVTYFTTDVRCVSCVKIEELTRRSVEQNFANELESGRLVFRMINTDQPDNRHFVNDYQLVSKTVVVSELINGEETNWVNVQEVWSLLRDEEKFVEHMSGIVRNFL